MTDVRVTDSEIYTKLMNLVLRFVSLRPRSKQEILSYITTKLKRSHTTAPEVRDAVMERVEELGYINDTSFAEWLVLGRTGRKPKGTRLIEQELLRKGVDRGVISAVIQNTMQRERSEIELARELARKKLPSWSNLPILNQKRKLADLLRRRGFSSETVWGIVDECFTKE